MNTRVSIAVGLLAAAMCMAACSGSSSAPAAPSPAAVNNGPPATTTSLSLAGNWNGPGANQLGRHTIELTITQSGTALSGTVQTRAADPNDGTCSSCHMNKLGTFTGTISGSTVSLNVTFPSGNQSEPTPICSAAMTINATNVTNSRIAGTYNGSDTCEGPWTDATVTIAHQ